MGLTATLFDAECDRCGRAESGRTTEQLREMGWVIHEMCSPNPEDCDVFCPQCPPRHRWQDAPAQRA